MKTYIIIPASSRKEADQVKLVVRSQEGEIKNFGCKFVVKPKTFSGCCTTRAAAAAEQHAFLDILLDALVFQECKTCQSSNTERTAVLIISFFWQFERSMPAINF